MRVHRRSTIVGMALALGVAAAACSVTSKRITAADIADTVVFETYRTDLGWNYELKGMYIDGSGGVWAYAQRGTPWYPERLKSGELSERDLLTKHKGAQRIGTVDLDVLVEMANRIPAAKRGRVTRARPEHEGHGSLAVAYEVDRSSRTYTEVILVGSGDLTATNDSGEAAALLDYLREVEEAVGYR